MQGFKSLWPTLAVGVALGVFGSANNAHADARPRYELVTSSPVLANGVLRFTYRDGVTVRVVSEDGSEVVGGFTEPGVWRPDEPFVVGRYTTDVSFEPNPDLAYDATFEVIAGQEPNYSFIDIQVTSTVEAGEVVEQACCVAGSAKAPSGRPCTANCKPLCVALAYAAVQAVDVYFAVDDGNVQANQTEIRGSGETSSGRYSEGHWRVEGAPDELCGVAEVFSWLDESTQLLTHCIENPKPTLTPIEAVVSSFGDISECSIPPIGYEEPWCYAQAYACEVQILTLDFDAQRSTAEACEHYYELCGRPSPVGVGNGSGDPGAATGDGAAIPGDGSGLHTEGAERPDAAQGCDCAVGSSGTHSGQRLLVWAVGLLAWRLRRRGSERATLA